MRRTSGRERTENATLECSPAEKDCVSEGWRSRELSSRVYSRPYHSSLSSMGVLRSWLESGSSAEGIS